MRRTYGHLRYYAVVNVAHVRPIFNYNIIDVLCTTNSMRRNTCRTVGSSKRESVKRAAQIELTNWKRIIFNEYKLVISCVTYTKARNIKISPNLFWISERGEKKKKKNIIIHRHIFSSGFFFNFSRKYSRIKEKNHG